MAGSTHMQPQFDFVFDYNYNDTYKFTLHTIFSGGFKLFEGSPDLTLLRFASPVTFNKFYPDINITDINKTKKTKDFSIYPNPTANQLSIINYQLSIIETVEIFDITGKVCKRTPITENKLSVKHLTPGIYFLKITTKTSVETIKFIKE